MRNEQPVPHLIERTGGLGPIRVHAPHESYGLTPASLVAVEAIGVHRALFRGRGIDWGSGTGCLAVAAAKVPGVERVLGLEISAPDVEVARSNARLNGVDEKVTFLHADSFRPMDDGGRVMLDAWRGGTAFLIANPPASAKGDGLEYRRTVLQDAREFLVAGAPAVVQISYQYGLDRIKRLEEDTPGFRYEGVLATSDWVPFDLDREDLSQQLVRYAVEENRGGLPYTFADPARPGESHVTAAAALKRYHATGEHPITRWQLHLFRYEPA